MRYCFRCHLATKCKFEAIVTKTNHLGTSTLRHPDAFIHLATNRFASAAVAFSLLAAFPIAAQTSLAGARGCLDVDGNNTVDLNDVVLINRYVFGFNGAALPLGSLGTNPTRTAPADIVNFIQGRNFDVDGNGRVELADLQLITRYVQGLTDAALTNNALGSTARRATTAAIQSFLGPAGGCVLSTLGIESLSFGGVNPTDVSVMVGEKRVIKPAAGLLPGTLPADIAYSVISGTGSGRLTAVNPPLQPLVFDATGATTGDTFAPMVRVTNTALNRSVDIPLSVSVVAPAFTASGNVTTAGGTVATPEGGVITFSTNTLSAPVDATLQTAPTADGGTLMRINFSQPVSAGAALSFALPYIPPTDAPATLATTSANRLKASGLTFRTPYANSEDSLGYRWQSYSAYYVLNGGYRLPSETLTICDPAFALSGEGALVPGSNKTIEVKTYQRGELNSVVSSSALSPATVADYEPILFIHGYHPNVSGGRGTWRDFPALAMDASQLGGRKLIPFEFRWYSNADFRDVAVDLVAAVNRIYAATGKPVHIVAHSFGGALARTLLQGLVRGLPAGNNGAALAQARVASLITLGAPHSGIMPTAGTVSGVALPKGQHSPAFTACDQISCHVMGEPVIDSASATETALRTLLGISVTPGEHAARLASTQGALPGIPINVGIGVTSDNGSNTDWDEGDQLISYNGQRFFPLDATSTASVGTALRVNASPSGGSAARITERILGLETRSSYVIGSTQNATEAAEPTRRLGYRHSGLTGYGVLSVSCDDAEGQCGVEAAPACWSAALCTHAGYRLLKSALSLPTSSLSSTFKLNDTGITFCGSAYYGNNLPCLGTDPVGQDKHFGRDAAALAGTLTKVGGSDGTNGFDYTKISNAGADLPASAALGAGANDWACTRDNVTGLIWEVKTTSGLRSISHTYTWFQTGSLDGNNGAASGGTCQTTGRCDTEKFAQDVNAATLCGRADWRMPHVKELIGIADMGRFGVAIDSTYFPNLNSNAHWSGSPAASTSSNAWAVHFSTVHSRNYSRNVSYYIRLVRAES